MSKSNEFIYADNAATTRLAPEVLDAMMPWLTEGYGNASSIYKLGRDAHAAIDKARRTVATCIGAGPTEIYFTSCGTESDNWALKGTMHMLAQKTEKPRLIISEIEHHAILHSAESLEKEGFLVTRIQPDNRGIVSCESLRKSISEIEAGNKDSSDETGSSIETIQSTGSTPKGLVSIMMANNELGTIQPVDEIAELCHEAGYIFHTDAVQAAGTLPINVKEQGIDMLSISAHKFHGPKGIGLLYSKRGLLPETMMDGGQQERGHRAGTENVASIVGMAKALELACSEREEKTNRLIAMRDVLRNGLSQIEGCTINGDLENCLPGTINCSFKGIDGQSLLFKLDLMGLAASSGSACASGSIEPSHVLLAIGKPYAEAHGSLRISLGKYNTIEEAHQIVKIVKDTVESIR